MIENADIAIAPARNFSELSGAFRLAYEQYCKQGYMSPDQSLLRFFLRELLPTTLTIVAMKEKQVIGTATGVLNSGAGLPSGELFKKEILQVCSGNIMEGTKFACDISGISPEELATVSHMISCDMIRWLFHWCMLQKVDDWIIVVNPKHIRFYERVLGFKSVGVQQKTCGHVENHPGLLLKLDVRDILQGSKKPTPRAKRLFFQKPIDPKEFSDIHQLSDQELALLLLEKPELLHSSNNSELQVLRDFRPLALDSATQCIKRAFSTKTLPWISIFPAFTDVLQLENQYFSKQQYSPRCFPLRFYLARICALLNIHALRSDVLFISSVSDDVPDSIISDPDFIGRALVNTITRFIDSARFNRNISLQVILILREGSSVDLCFSIKGEIQSIPQFSIQMSREMNAEVVFLPGASELRINISALVFEDAIFLPTEESNKSILVKNLDSHPKLKILLVEDNVIHQKVTTRLLEKQKHSVQIASNGEIALLMFQKHSYDLLLMDCQMPILDGFKTAVAIREYEQRLSLKRTPIVALTAFVMNGDRERCLKAGMDDYITKPVSASDLKKITAQPKPGTNSEISSMKSASNW